MVLLALLAGAAEQPSPQTLVYYNARMALREQRPLEATRLWLLRNAVEDATGQVSVHDGDFQSVTWAALGELGICQDGLAADDDGAGLHPLALHNWVTRNMSRRIPAARPRPFDAFEGDVQARFFGIHDVLSGEELKTAHLFRGRCLAWRVDLVESGQLPNADLADRAVAAKLLMHLLERSRETLVHERVVGEAVIEARLFDLKLQIAELAERKARQEARDRARRLSEDGMPRQSVRAFDEDAPLTVLSPESPAGRLLLGSLEWSIREWLTLSDDRRLFVFDAARKLGADEPRLRGIALGILDALVEQGRGEEVSAWIARVDASPEVIWAGDRGRTLLALDPLSGFDERAVVALHRGVAQLQEGDLGASLRSFAFALQEAPRSRREEEVAGLARRWLSYVAAQYTIGEPLLITLKQLVPRRDYSAILEDLLWRAAFHADAGSFAVGLRNQVGRGALERRVDLLLPLADGDLRRFERDLRARLESSTGETLRFLEQLLERLELEDADVRTDQAPTVLRIRRLLVPFAEDEQGGRQQRRATALLARSQALLEGIGAFDEASLTDRARALAPAGETFAGAVRLAPSDALPWPFAVVEVDAPSAFSPLQLTPIEWRADGERVLGWRISE